MIPDEERYAEWKEGKPKPWAWLGPYQGQQATSKNKVKCSHCGKDVYEAWVYEDGLAYYCSDECLLQHFTAEEWRKLLERANDEFMLEPELAYYIDLTDRGKKWHY